MERNCASGRKRSDLLTLRRKTERHRQHGNAPDQGSNLEGGSKDSETSFAVRSAPREIGAPLAGCHRVGVGQAGLEHTMTGQLVIQ
jgi:hypothetical protein